MAAEPVGVGAGVAWATAGGEGRGPGRASPLARTPPASVVVLSPLAGVTLGGVPRRRGEIAEPDASVLGDVPRHRPAHGRKPLAGRHVVHHRQQRAGENRFQPRPERLEARRVRLPPRVAAGEELTNPKDLIGLGRRERVERAGRSKGARPLHIWEVQTQVDRETHRLGSVEAPLRFLEVHALSDIAAVSLEVLAGSSKAVRAQKGAGAFGEFLECRDGVYSRKSTGPLAPLQQLSIRCPDDRRGT